MGRADLDERADGEVWNALKVCFAEARSSQHSSFVFLTGTSGVGKTKIASDIGREVALVVVIPTIATPGSTFVSAPYRHLIQLVDEISDAAKQADSQHRFKRYQQCAVIYFAHMILSHLEFVVEVCEYAYRKQKVRDRGRLLEIAIRAQC